MTTNTSTPVVETRPTILSDVPPAENAPQLQVTTHDRCFIGHLDEPIPPSLRAPRIDITATDASHVPALVAAMFRRIQAKGLFPFLWIVPALVEEFVDTAAPLLVQHWQATEPAYHRGAPNVILANARDRLRESIYPPGERPGQWSIVVFGDGGVPDPVHYVLSSPGERRLVDWEVYERAADRLDEALEAAQEPTEKEDTTFVNSQREPPQRQITAVQQATNESACLAVYRRLRADGLQVSEREIRKRLRKAGAKGQDRKLSKEYHAYTDALDQEA